MQLKLCKTFLNKDTRQAPGAPASGKQETAVVKSASVNSSCFNPCSKYVKQLATVDESGKLVIWDSLKGQKLIEEPSVANSPLNSVSIEREGKIVGCGGIDMKIHVFRINNQGLNKKEKVRSIEKVRELSGHMGDINAIRFLNQQFVVSASNDSQILLWDLENSGRFIVKYGQHQDNVVSLDTFSLDGNVMASGSNDATIRIWDIRMKSPCIRLFSKNKTGISSVKFMPDK